jgi:hypothetical protein
MTPEGMYLIDGFDLWKYFGITIERGGLNDFLKIPKRKESIQHNWNDEDGLDIDLSRVYVEARTIIIKCVVIADNEPAFFDQYNRFLTILRKPGTRRLSVDVFGIDYYVFYKDCTIYEKLTPFKQTGKLICKFTMTVVESVPGFQSLPTYLTDDTGQFIIT